MAYGRVSETFWTDHRVRAMSENARYMELYLRTAPHRNRLGLFVLDPNYATGDLQWPVEQVGSVFEELEQAGRIKWDHTARVVFVCDTLKVERLANQNVVIGALNDLETVPHTVLLSELLKSVNSNYLDHYAPLVEKLEERVGNEEKTVLIKDSNGYPNHSPNGLGTQALPSPASTNLNPSSPSLTQPEGGKNEKERVWNAVREIVFNDWHQGSEKIELSDGGTIGMGAEHGNVFELVETYGEEETIGAITVGRQVFNFDEPTSLRWYTSRQQGPANFNNAVGQWRKTAQ